MPFLSRRYPLIRLWPSNRRSRESQLTLDPTILDAYVGRYEFPRHPSFPTGIKAMIRREGEQLIWQAEGKNIIPVPFNMYAQSEIEFFLKLTGGQLSFPRDEDNEEVQSVIIRGDICLPDVEGKTLK